MDRAAGHASSCHGCLLLLPHSQHPLLLLLLQSCLLLLLDHGLLLRAVLWGLLQHPSWHAPLDSARHAPLDSAWHAPLYGARHAWSWHAPLQLLVHHLEPIGCTAVRGQGHSGAGGGDCTTLNLDGTAQCCNQLTISFNNCTIRVLS